MSGAPEPNIERLAAEVRELAADRGVPIEALVAALAAAPSARAVPAWTGRALAWLGALLVFAGIAIYAVTFWEDFGSAVRIAITLGTGIAAWLAALIGNRVPAMATSIVPLVCAGAGLEAAGILVTLEEFGAGGDEHLAIMLTAGVIGVQALLFGAAMRRVVLPFIAGLAGVAFAVTLLDWFDMRGALNAALVSSAVLIAASSRPASVFAPAWFGAASAVLYWSVFDLLEGHAGQWLLLALPPAGVWLGSRLPSRVLLVTSAVALLGYLGYFTGEYFKDQIGWPLALMFLGLTFLAVSVVTTRIIRRLPENETRS